MSELPSIDRLNELREKYGAPRHGDYVNTTMPRDELLSLFGCAIAIRGLEEWLRDNRHGEYRHAELDEAGIALWTQHPMDEIRPFAEAEAPTLLAALVRALDQAERRT